MFSRRLLLAIVALSVIIAGVFLIYYLVKGTPFYTAKIVFSLDLSSLGKKEPVILAEVGSQQLSQPLPATIDFGGLPTELPVTISATNGSSFAPSIEVAAEFQSSGGGEVITVNLQTLNFDTIAASELTSEATVILPLTALPEVLTVTVPQALTITPIAEPNIIFQIISDAFSAVINFIISLYNAVIASIADALKADLFDFGDAPDPNFPTLLSSNGAHHADVTKFYLGKEVDTERDAQLVNRDSQNKEIGPDDGLTLVPGDAQSLVIEIHNKNWSPDEPIILNALFDINKNFKWDVSADNSKEHIVVDKKFFIKQDESKYATIQIPIPVKAGELPWLRLTVTKDELGAIWPGTGDFELGETEDYYSPPPLIPVKFPPFHPAVLSGPPTSGDGPGSAGGGDGGSPASGGGSGSPGTGGTGLSEPTTPAEPVKPTSPTTNDPKPTEITEGDVIIGTEPVPAHSFWSSLWRSPEITEDDVVGTEPVPPKPLIPPINLDLIDGAAGEDVLTAPTEKSVVQRIFDNITNVISFVVDAVIPTRQGIITDTETSENILLPRDIETFSVLEPIQPSSDVHSVISSGVRSITEKIIIPSVKDGFSTPEQFIQPFYVAPIDISKTVEALTPQPQPKFVPKTTTELSNDLAKGLESLKVSLESFAAKRLPQPATQVITAVNKQALLLPGQCKIKLTYVGGKLRGEYAFETKANVIIGLFGKYGEEVGKYNIAAGVTGVGPFEIILNYFANVSSDVMFPVQRWVSLVGATPESVPAALRSSYRAPNYTYAKVYAEDAVDPKNPRCENTWVLSYETSFSNPSVQSGFAATERPAAAACAAISITPTTLANGTQDVAYSRTLSQTGGAAGGTWTISAGSLPVGMTINSGTGALGGTPTVVETATFTVTYTAGSCTGSQAYSLIIDVGGFGFAPTKQLAWR